MHGSGTQHVALLYETTTSAETVTALSVPDWETPGWILPTSRSSLQKPSPSTCSPACSVSDSPQNHPEEDFDTTDKEGSCCMSRIQKLSVVIKLHPQSYLGWAGLNHFMRLKCWASPSPGMRQHQFNITSLWVSCCL